MIFIIVRTEAGL